MEVERAMLLMPYCSFLAIGHRKFVQRRSVCSSIRPQIAIIFIFAQSPCTFAKLSTMYKWKFNRNLFIKFVGRSKYWFHKSRRKWYFCVANRIQRQFKQVGFSQFYSFNYKYLWRYTLNGRTVKFKDVSELLRTNGIDLVHNRFLILQV